MLRHTRIVNLILAILLICSSVVMAGAVTPASEVGEENPASEARGGYLEDQFDEGGVTYIKLHTLTVSDLSDFIRNASKRITVNSLPDDAIGLYAIGRLTKSGVSYGASNEIRTGLCYYEQSIGDYLPCYYRNVNSGVEFSERLCSVSSLNKNEIYFPFIENLDASYGNVSGTVGFYYTEP